MSAKGVAPLVACCLVLASVLLPISAPAERAAAHAEADLPVLAGQAPGAPSSYAQLPPLFVENRGQTDPEVAFTLQGGAAAVFFTSTGVTYALVERPPDRARPAAERAMPGSRLAAQAPSEPGRRWAVKLDFVGANPYVRPVGEERAEASVSYFRGRPEDWHTGLAAYRRIVYPDLWPGIDLAYHGAAGGGLKYEFEVHPGADPAQIRLTYRGAADVELDAAGRLAVTTPAGGFTDDVPVA